MHSTTSSNLKIKILHIALKLFLGFMLISGGMDKFKKPIPAPNKMIEQVKAGEEVAPNTEVLMIKNFFFGLKQSNYFWQFLGFAELLAGALVLSQIFWMIGAFIALPITLNIFLFHLFLETDETGELLMTMAMLLINIWFIISSYEKWKGIVIDKSAVQFKATAQ
ncbi:DoxX protein [Flavobacterium sp.]|uniref:DoxX protein n=1 Tax=Flavobacterium sp. TaxID=239 RepID=UPI0039E2751D